MADAGTTPRGASARTNSLATLVSQVLSGVITAVITLYLVRVLSPSQFGTFALAVSIGAVLVYLMDFGLTAATARDVASRHGDPRGVAATTSTALLLKVPLAVVVAVVMALAAPWIADLFKDPSLATALPPVVVACVGMTFVQFTLANLVARREARARLAVVLPESLVELAATVAIVAVWASAVGAAAGRAVGYAVGAAAGLYLLFRRSARHWRERLGRAETRELLAYGRALLLVTATFIVLDRIDVLLIAMYYGPQEVAFFEAPLRFVLIATYAGVALASGVGPLLANDGTRQRGVAALGRGLDYLLLIYAPVAVIAATWAAPIIELAFGADYEPSVAVLRGLAPFLLVASLAALASGALDYAGHARIRFRIAVVSLALNAALDVVLLPRVGIWGAALATAVAMSFYVVAHLVVCRRALGLALGPRLRTLAMATAASAGFAVPVAVLGDHAAVFAGALVLGTCLYVAALVRFGIIERSRLDPSRLLYRRRAMGEADSRFKLMEKARYALEDAYPPVGLPLAHKAVSAARPPYRRRRAHQRQLAERVSPDMKVMRGPFAGMAFHKSTIGGVLLPKVAGSYEQEIAADVERLIAADPPLVVIVGAAEGYYAVGMALRLPNARIVAFEARRSGRWLSQRLAEANGVDVEILGFATADAMNDALGEGHRALVIMDVDGGERVLADPEAIPGLRNASVLIETHDHLAPGVTEQIKQRFGASHDVQWRPAADRDPAQLEGFSPEDARMVLEEYRPDQGWLVLTPKG